MDAIEQSDAVLEQTLEAGEEPQGAEQSTQEAVAQEEVVPQEEVAQAARFKMIREAREKAERDRDAAARERDELKAQLKYIREAQGAPQQKTEVQDYSVAPDDIVEGRHLSKYDKEIQALKQELQKTRQEAVAVSVEGRLKAQYVDFDSVVNKENLEVLRHTHPEIAATIDHSPDLYSKAVAAYTLLKKFGIAQSSQQQERAAQIAHNAAKPQSSSAAASQGSDSPIARASAMGSALSEARKREIHAETMRLIRGH